MTIQNITAREILNSGATTSLEVTVTLSNGAKGVASVPFGASAGAYEAHVLFDNDKKRYHGRGMQRAVENVNTEIRELLLGESVFAQGDIDKKMIALDNTPNKSRLGANAILGVSVAVARAAAVAKNMELYQYIQTELLGGQDTQERNKKGGEKGSGKSEKLVLPKPMIVVIEGGKHADDSTDFQEYLIVPEIKDGNGNYSAKESVRAGAEIYLALKKILKDKGYNTNVGNEGAYAPSGIKNNDEPWEFIIAAIEAAGYVPGKDIYLATDPAATELIAENSDKESELVQYQLKREDRFLSSDELIRYFADLVRRYPYFVSLEDILGEDDWKSWSAAQKALGASVRLIGDDLLVTNPTRLKKAIKEKSCDGILIKLNQIGTLSETLETVRVAHDAGFWTIVSHRGGGETNDTAMIDLAVAVGARMVKVGIARGERVCKYNRLMEIEEQMHH